MPRVTIIFAILLILLGIVGFVGDSATESQISVADPNSASPAPAVDQANTTPKRSITALIPTFTGGLLLIFGAIATSEKLRMHAMHGAVLVGLLGFLAAGGRGLMGIVKMLTTDAAVNTRSLFFVCTMAVLCGLFVVLCVNSFIQARRSRDDENQ